MLLIAWETSLFNGCICTHTQLASYTQREICNHVLREKTPQKVQTSTKTEEKPQKVLIAASFEGDDEKAQYASFKNNFI